jgi:hypothetical protein
LPFVAIEPILSRLMLKNGILSVQMMRSWYEQRQDWSRREPIVKINDQKVEGLYDTSGARLVEYTLSLKPFIGTNSTMPRPKAAIRRTSWHLSCHECRELSPASSTLASCGEVGDDIHIRSVRQVWVGSRTDLQLERFSVHHLHDTSRDFCGSFESGTELARMSVGRPSELLSRKSRDWLTSIPVM